MLTISSTITTTVVIGHVSFVQPRVGSCRMQCLSRAPCQPSFLNFKIVEVPERSGPYSALQTKQVVIALCAYLFNALFALNSYIVSCICYPLSTATLKHCCTQTHTSFRMSLTGNNRQHFFRKQCICFSFRIRDSMPGTGQLKSRCNQCIGFRA